MKWSSVKILRFVLVRMLVLFVAVKIMKEQKSLDLVTSGILTMVDLSLMDLPE
jgi:hypothetical protein